MSEEKKPDPTPKSVQGVRYVLAHVHHSLLDVFADQDDATVAGLITGYIDPRAGSFICDPFLRALLQHAIARLIRAQGDKASSEFVRSAMALAMEPGEVEVTTVPTKPKDPFCA